MRLDVKESICSADGDVIKNGCRYEIKNIHGRYKVMVMTIEGTTLKIIKIKTILQQIFTTNLFLEFYFPFILFTFAMLESFDWHITKPLLYVLNW